MGNKDYTDYNGRKRKELISPSPEKITWRRGGGKKKIVGIKTAADRYLAEHRAIRHWLKHRKQYRGKVGRGLGKHWHSDIIRRYVKALRKLRDDYAKAGKLEAVLAYLKAKLPGYF